MTYLDRPARLPLQPAWLPGLALAALLLLPLAPAQALAEPIRVSAVADAGQDPVQARQQAQERVFVEAVHQTALRLLPAPLSTQRAELLRQFLASRAAGLVQSFQEAPAAKAHAPASAEKPVPLEMDVEVNRAAISELLSHLGLLAGTKHPKGFTLRLGPGVAEADLKPLADLLALQGLTRQAPVQAPAQVQTPAQVQVTLERVPQGYLKAVLYAGANTFVADSQDLARLWLDVWGRYFSAREQQPGGTGSPVVISGFHQVGAVLDFTKILQSWDDCLREVQLNVVDLRVGNSTGRWSARLTSPERLDARLKEYLPSRKLTAVR